MQVKQVFTTIGISAATAIVVLFGYAKLTKNSNTYAGQVAGSMPPNYKQAGWFGDGTTPPGSSTDFVATAAAATPTVVHIKTKTNAKQVTNNLPRARQNSPFDDFFGGSDMFEDFFGNRGIVPEQRASGSGVIISEDGYIITNNHVIDKADEINVTLNNKKTYKATVVGADPSYDLAVLKIDAKGLPFLLYGNSDEVKVGQWVLAIGYPLNLETTVTAGIISAKNKSIGLNRDKQGNRSGGVESFIQTDAAVNQGNSGGALVGTDAKLVGINSAIASPTGYYSGYSYAIPVNLVKKVVDDIIKYGTVQRGYIGVAFVDVSILSDEEKKRGSLPANAQGIYITDVPKDGAAYKGGIRKGDEITKINEVALSSGNEMQEQVSRYKPGDKINVTYLRNGKEAVAVVALQNKAGNFEVVKDNDVNALQKLGAEFETLDAKKAREYEVAGGVTVKKIKPNAGAIGQQTRMKDGFIILNVNGKNVKSVDELKAAIGANKEVVLNGFYPGYDGLYEFQFSLEDEEQQ
jgi:serine protease Do